MSEILEYKCPSCGGALEFDSTLQKMKCPFCDSEFEMDVLKELDSTLKQAKPDDMKWETPAGSEWQEGEKEGMFVYVCNSCGGEIVGDANTAATSCPYCGNPVVMSGQFSGSLRPDIVIPFKLDKAAAKEGLTKHLKGKRLLPKVFKDQNHIDEIKGVYVPFWLFDADASANMHFKASRTRSWSDSKNHYTETSFYSILRSGNVCFNCVPVDGSSKMADDLMESIEPFNIAEAVPFQTAYLAGYLADKYDVTAELSENHANERIRRSTEEQFASTVKGYSNVTTQSSNIQLYNGSARYALYPVWLLNTTWNGKQYTFAMNGQTGKFVGDLPLDKKAYWRWFGIITGAATLLSYAAMWIFNKM